MAKITKVDVIVSTYQGKEKKSYKFTLDDGKMGYASNKDPWDFKEGDMVSYTTEIKKSSKGEYNLFTLTRLSGNQALQQQQNIPNLPVSSPVEPRSPSVGIPALEIFKAKVEANIRVMEVILNAFFEGKTDNLKSIEKFNEWKVIMENTVDDIAKE